MKPAFFISALLSAIPAVFISAAQAETGDRTLCRYGNQTRIIEVKYPGEGQIPCEVHYSKDSGSQVLWSAQTEGGYCEQKAAEFVEKQRGWGWTCETTVAITEETDSNGMPEATASPAPATAAADGVQGEESQREETPPENTSTETAATAE